ncbi:MAG: hypothetical protein Q8K98_10035 [Bacteroidota bacterium]|nr:hypothetical protein [Bacteroidota bacterium]
MNIFQLEDRLKQFPSSALAVRLASLYVARFRIDEVFKLCIESIKRYPKHSTSYLILGRGYAALRQYEAAILCSEKALSLQPDSLLAQNLISNWRQIILTNGEKKRLEALEILSAPTIDELQKLLKDEPNDIIEPQKENAQATPENNRALPEIVSVTLADIYTKQGEYAEAIKMYRALIIQRPKQKEFFEKNILALEEKLK